MNLKAFVLIILGFLFFFKQGVAQYTSINGQFEVDQQLGCNNLTVTITNIDPGTDPSVIVFQFDGFNSPTTQDPVHTYITPGTYWINQYIQGATGQKKDSVMVTVVAPELPNVELFSCNNLEVLVQIYDTYYDVYEVDYGDGTVVYINSGDPVPPYTYTNASSRTISITGLFTTATNRCGATTNIFVPTTAVLPAQIDSLVALDNTTLKLDFNLPDHSVNKLEVSVGDNTNFVLFQSLNQSVNADTLTSLDITQNNYCFRIATYDACSNFKSYSNEVCSVNLTSEAQNNQIVINWNTIDLGGGQTTAIYRDESPLLTLPSTTIQYIDSTVICNMLYCYQVDIQFTGGAVSRSTQTCETAFSTDTPPEIENISSTTNEEFVNWEWEVPSGASATNFTVYELDSNGNTIRTESTASNTYTSIFNDSIQYLAVGLIDDCDNVSEVNNIASNLVLSGARNAAEEIVLTWNDYFGWIDGLQEYMLSIKDSQGNLLDSLSVGSNTTYNLPLDDQEEQTLLFSIWAIPVKDSLSPSKSNELTFEHPPIISIPNGFTPNGDGLNDRFMIQGKFIESYELQIYNRWGEVLFYTTDMDNGWDGNSFEGEKLPIGNYAYWVRLKDFNGKEHLRTGSVLILSN